MTKNISNPNEKDAVEESKSVESSSKICVIHSRYASNRTMISEEYAHPVFDNQNRILIFHNGFITNTTELIEELA